MSNDVKFLFETELFPYSREYFEIMKEFYEISALEQYIENLEYYSELQLDFFEGTIPFTDTYFQDFSLPYTEAKDILKSKKKGLLARLLDKFMRIIRGASRVSQKLTMDNMEFYQNSNKFDIHRMDQEWFNHVWTKKEILNLAKVHSLDMKKYSKMVILINKGENPPQLHFDSSVDEKLRRGFTNFTMLGFKYGCKIVLKSVMDEEPKNKVPAYAPQYVKGSGNLASTLVTVGGAVASAGIMAYGLSKISGVVMSTTQIGRTVGNIVDEVKKGDTGRAIENINKMREELEKTQATYDPSSPEQAKLVRAACQKLENDMANHINGIQNQLNLTSQRITSTFDKKDADYLASQERNKVASTAASSLGAVGSSLKNVVTGKGTTSDLKDTIKTGIANTRDQYKKAKDAEVISNTKGDELREVQNAEAASGQYLDKITQDNVTSMNIIAQMTHTADTAEQKASQMAVNSVRAVSNLARNVQSGGLAAALSGEIKPALTDGSPEPTMALPDGGDIMDEPIEVSSDSTSNTQDEQAARDRKILDEVSSIPRATHQVVQNQKPAKKKSSSFKKQIRRGLRDFNGGLRDFNDGLNKKLGKSKSK